MKEGKYFYKCDNCGLSKEVTGTTWNDFDTAKREMLKEGWVMCYDMHGEVWSGTEKKGCPCGGSFSTKGEYCSDKCLLKKIADDIKMRRMRI